MKIILICIMNCTKHSAINSSLHQLLISLTVQLFSFVKIENLILLHCGRDSTYIVIILLYDESIQVNFL